MQGDQEFTQYADPTTPGIVIYAEVLLNIRTVTLFASLRTAPNVETKARLSADGKSLSVTHEGDTGTIRLPLKAKGDGNAHITIPADPKKKEIALRLQIEEEEGHDDLFGLHHSEERKANIVPWDGASLNEIKDLTVLCKSCRETILARGKVSEWRDLPNENWAEMMDFWHCHKPDEHHLHDHKHDETVAKKGYAAGARLKAATSIGFVDLSSLLLKEQDCDGVQVGTYFLQSQGRKESDLSPYPMAASTIQAPEKNLHLAALRISSSERSMGFRCCELERPVSVSLSIFPETLGTGRMRAGYIPIINTKSSFHVHFLT